MFFLKDLYSTFWFCIPKDLFNLKIILSWFHVNTYFYSHMNDFTYDLAREYKCPFYEHLTSYELDMRIV